MKPIPAPTAVRAFPHVSGQTTRFKAEPTKITGVAARVMAASGNFSTKRGAARSSSGMFLGALVLVVAAGALAVTGDARPVGGEARVTATQLAVADHLSSLGAGEFMEPAASAPPDTLDAQDRFEIARLFRLTARVNAAASQELAPAAGPAR